MKKVNTYVILVSYNSKKDIKECLDSLLKQDYKFFEIIIVDNNSTDGSFEYLNENYPSLKLIKNKKNFGFAKANNQVIKYSLKNPNIKYIVCLNFDTKVDRKWLSEMIKLAKNKPSFGSIQSKVLLYANPNRINTSGNDINYLGVGICGNYFKKSSTERKIKEISYASGSSVLYSKESLRNVGFFDEEYFMYKEDMDLGWRLKLAGYKNFLAPNSIVFHKYSFSKNKNKFYYIERNRLITIFKNYSLKSLILIFPMMFLFEIGMLFYSIKSGFFKSKLEGYHYLLKNYKKIRLKRKDIQKIRKVDDRIITKNFVGKIEFEEIKNPILYKIANPMLSVYWSCIKRWV